MAAIKVREIYDRRASYYNLLIKVLSLSRDAAYRQEAIQRLDLKPGARVLDLGCGTGLNFRYMEEQIGSQGFILGLDESFGMLCQARNCIKRNKWNNIKLIQGDVTELTFSTKASKQFDAVIFSYLLTTVAKYKEAIDLALKVLKKGGRIVLADDRLPSGWFAGPRVMLKRLINDGWRNYEREIVCRLKENVSDLQISNHHFGLIFIVSGIKKN